MVTPNTACCTSCPPATLALRHHAGFPPRAHHPPATCRRDYAAYGKGCCCTAFGCCRKKCRTGFKDDGGCMCKRDANTIWKSTYDRGAGYAKYRTRIKDSYMPGSRTAIRSFTKRTSWRDTKPLTCPPGKENDAGLCYTPCASGYVGEQGGGCQHGTWGRGQGGRGQGGRGHAPACV